VPNVSRSVRVSSDEFTVLDMITDYDLCNRKSFLLVLNIG
jgi:hypothetical protein